MSRDANLRMMTARHPGRCAETGRWIQPGERIVFAPVSRRIYSWHSRVAKATREAQQQERMTA